MSLSQLIEQGLLDTSREGSLMLADLYEEQGEELLSLWFHLLAQREGSSLLEMEGDWKFRLFLTRTPINGYQGSCYIWQDNKDEEWRFLPSQPWCFEGRSTTTKRKICYFEILPPPREVVIALTNVLKRILSCPPR